MDFLSGYMGFHEFLEGVLNSDERERRKAPEASRAVRRSNICSEVILDTQILYWRNCIFAFYAES